MEPYLSEIRVFGFGFIPRGWLACNGQTLAINQYTALFSLLGTTYGGNGTTTFQLPNLQSAAMMGWGNSPWGTSYIQGQRGGVENVTLLQTQIPQHNHIVNAQTGLGNAALPNTTASLAVPTQTATPSDAYNLYTNVLQQALVPLEPRTISTVGSNTAHSNMPPFAVVNFCICMSGIFPSRN